MTAPPGAFTYNTLLESNRYDEGQRAAEIAASMLAVSLGKQSQSQDSQWKTPRKVASHKVKDKKTLKCMIEEVWKAKKPAFKQQKHNIMVFL